MPTHLKNISSIRQ